MDTTHRVSRRTFIAQSLATAALPVVAEAHPGGQGTAPGRTISLGVVGLGGRGAWIADLFRKHGGYRLHAVEDYFPDVAHQRGAALGVDPSRRFSGLSGYKRVIESGVEAIALENLPYFFPQQASDAVDAGLHVYMAKPVASDVPGVVSIRESAVRAGRARRVFFVDYQMPTDPHNAGAIERVRSGALGALQVVYSAGAVGGKGFDDPPPGATLEPRMQKLTWVNDDALGCGYIGNYDIHVIDAVLRAVGQMPVRAHGWGTRVRPTPHGDALDTLFVMFTFADGTVWNHQSPKGDCEPWFAANGSLAAAFQGDAASARVSYWGRAHVRGGPRHFGGGSVENLYEAGAVRNIATFHGRVVAGDVTNETVTPAVDSALVSILGREAAGRRATVTLDQVLTEARHLPVDLKGLRA